jgi:ketosteroid isomerase-like protein
MKTRTLFALTFLVSAPAFASQTATQSKTPAVSAEESAVRNALSGLGAADKAGDMAAVLNHYADDAMILPPNAPVLAGQSGVRSFYEILFNNFHVDDVSFDADEIHVAGDWAFAQGFINGQLTPKTEGAPPRKLHEKFLMVLHREKNAWKIFRIIWNASEPPQAAPK